ncbi:MAG: hypothetical protein OYH76_05240 [Defluviicoccus sp.]|nr:hypothetical protein [Defluviicoccus sp.]MDE0275280.1 hypothetical protein [Defluviicoccus sp.]
MNPRSLGTFVAVSISAALIAAASPPALAQDNRPRDSSGAVMDLSRWHSMPTHEFMLNIVDLPGAAFTRAQRRVRNKGIPHERIRFDGGEGSMFVEHILSGVYNSYVTDRLQNRADMDRRLDRFGQRHGQVFEVVENRKIYRYGERGGWVYAIRGRRTGETCIVSRFGFLSDWAKIGQRTGEHYDTSITFRDCSGKRSLDDVVKWVNSAKIVELPYNRVR